jgi:hypothetical protein
MPLPQQPVPQVQHGPLPPPPPGQAPLPPPIWYQNINNIQINQIDALEDSIVADMKYIINHAKIIPGGRLARDRCKIPILESRFFTQSDSQKFGIEHKTTVGVGNIKKIYDIGKFEENFKSDPSGMAEIIQEIFNKNSTYDYDQKEIKLTKKTPDDHLTPITIPQDEVFIIPNNIQIKDNCNDIYNDPNNLFQDDLPQQP